MITLTTHFLILVFVFQAVELAVDESSFTGETEPVVKSTEVEAKKTSNGVAELKNVAFMGTLVRCGRGKVGLKPFLLLRVFLYSHYPKDYAPSFRGNL